MASPSKPVWHLALQWEGSPKQVLIVATVCPKEALERIGFYSRSRLVVVKAWLGPSTLSPSIAFSPELASSFLEGSMDMAWFTLSEPVRAFLKQQKGVSLKDRRKANLMDLPKVMWRPMEESKKERLEDSQFPSWVDSAQRVVLHILSEAAEPLTTAEILKQGEGSYKVKTLRNAIDDLRCHRSIDAMHGEWNEPRVWLLTTKGLNFLEQCRK
jgi:hypothetical protein